jgi:hypothetical protein
MKTFATDPFCFAPWDTLHACCDSLDRNALSQQTIITLLFKKIASLNFCEGSVRILGLLLWHSIHELRGLFLVYWTRKSLMHGFNNIFI